VRVSACMCECVCECDGGLIEVFVLCVLVWRFSVLLCLCVCVCIMCVCMYLFTVNVGTKQCRTIQCGDTLQSGDQKQVAHFVGTLIMHNYISTSYKPNIYIQNNKSISYRGFPLSLSLQCQ
jgi:hypothetical protein